MQKTSVRPGWDTGDWTGLPPVTVHAYDPAWAEQYARAEDEVARALAGIEVRIEHIGSTSVPGLGARKGIDILLGLQDMADAAACVERLEELGYRHHFSKPDWVHLSGRGHKLHLSPLGSRAWTDPLLFRDHLRRHPETAAAYDRLKQALARTHGADGRRYVEGKSDFVRAVVECARREHDSPSAP